LIHPNGHTEFVHFPHLATGQFCRNPHGWPRPAYINHQFFEMAGNVLRQGQEMFNMRSIILYVLGVPVTIIVLIALFTHHF
jgi:hypothetical protein